MAPQCPPRPADCMRRPPATAPPMPIAMSMTVPSPSPLRIFPPNQPATNPTRIHDKRYIQFSFRCIQDLPLSAAPALIFISIRNLACSCDPILPHNLRGANVVRPHETE